MVRGVLLVIAAVVVGLLLLNEIDDTSPRRVVTAATTTTTETEGGGRSTTTAAKAARNPAEVTVLVANGSGISGAAGKLSNQLKAANYLTATPTDAKARAAASVVYFIPGFELDAEAVAQLLGDDIEVAAMPTSPPVAELGAAEVLVVVAADLVNA